MPRLSWTSRATVAVAILASLLSGSVARGDEGWTQLEWKADSLTSKDAMGAALAGLDGFELVETQSFQERKFGECEGHELICTAKVGGTDAELGAVAIIDPKGGRNVVAYTFYKLSEKNSDIERKIIEGIRLE